jgi:hypothetical protein
MDALAAAERAVEVVRVLLEIATHVERIDARLAPNDGRPRLGS